MVRASELTDQSDRVLLYGFDMISRYRDPETIFHHDRVYLVTLRSGVIQRFKIEGDKVVHFLDGETCPAWMLSPDITVETGESDFQFVQLLMSARVVVPLRYSERNEETIRRLTALTNKKKYR